MNKKIYSIFILMFMSSMVFFGCNKEEKNSKQQSTDNKEVKQSITTTVTNTNTTNPNGQQNPANVTNTVQKEEKELKPNELGDIMVVMYHGIVNTQPETPYQRKLEDFKKDLEYMYKNKYRLISLNDYINNNINIPAGYTPILLTFDDGLSSEFSLVDENGVLKPAKDTAVDVIDKFAEQHPDFGKSAVFFMNGDDNPFKGAGTLKQRLEYLVNNGYDVGNHSFDHMHLKKLEQDKLQQQIGSVEKIIKEYIPNYTVQAVSYPFGERPNEDVRTFALQGQYQNTKYTYKLAFREGPSSVLAPTTHIKFDPLNVPRVRGSVGEQGDLWWYFKYYETYPQNRYISDGNATTITISKNDEKNLNKEKLKDKKVVFLEDQVQPQVTNQTTTTNANATTNTIAPQVQNNTTTQVNKTSTKK